ncbi:DUF2177 family protein [Pararhizobium mangrovi]|uniref:DUF2177 family protein n=1 Tax=Pararhizobium mangrovi TaxID=2590452 RepID=UPI001F3D4244|nr:DUF2177 family protein [Pararhizobium mangrovi]
MKYVYVYLIATVIFLGLDALWLGVVAKNFYQAQIGELMLDKPRFGVAAGFYAIYVVGLLYFALVPALNEGSLPKVLVASLLFGFFCYATYEATNLATLRGWTNAMAAADIAWGTVLTAIAGCVTYAIVQGIGFWHA